MSVREDYQRARSAAEKEDRRRIIREAAYGLVCEKGMDGVTMDAVARAASVAKGTLYLYFTTKEEVLLDLYGGSVERFCGAMRKGLRKGMSNRAFVRLMFRAAMADPLLVPLGAQLTTVIERNVSDEALIIAKRSMSALVVGLSEEVEAKLGLKPGQGMEAIFGLRIILMGAAQSDLASHIDTSPLPQDVRDMIEGHGLDLAFPPLALTYLNGLWGPR